MTQHVHDANDGSVQEIAVNSRNPIVAVQETPAVSLPAEDGHGAASRQGSSGSESPPATLLLTDKQEASVTPAKIQTGMVAVARLRPYAKNAEIYREREDAVLLESIRANGVRNDLLVDDDGVVYGGTTRLRYAEQTGWAEVPVKVISFKTEDEKVLRLIDDNLYRKKTLEEETREYMVRKAIETREATRRKAEAGKKHGKQPEEVKIVAPLAGKKGKARALASEGSGRSGVSLEKGCKVVEAADKVRREGDAKTADELLAKLNKGYTPALKFAQSLGLITKPKPKAGKAGAGTKNKAAAVVQTEVTGLTTPTTTSVSVDPAVFPAAPAGDSIVPPATTEPRVNVAAPSGEVAEPEDEDEDSEDQIVADYIKAAVKLAGVMAENLTLDLRRNLLRAYEDAREWVAYNKEVLRANH